MKDDQESNDGLRPGGIGIPDEVLQNLHLSVTEKILFGYIQNLSRTSRGCWATNRVLGNMVGGLGPQTISNSLSHLEDFHYIIIELTYGKFGVQRAIFINQNYKNIYSPLVKAYHDNYSKMDSDTLVKTLYTSIKGIIDVYKVVNRVKDNIKDDINFPFSKEKGEVEVENPTAPPSPSLRHRRPSTVIRNTPPAMRKKITKEPIEPFPIPKSIKDLLDFWHKQNLKSNRLATKEMKKNIQYLKVLKRGTLYEKFKVHEEFRDKKFTDEEIKQAITNFALAALQPNYDPAPGRYKDILKNTSLNKFIYNSFSTNGNASLFIKYFQEPPRMLPVSGVAVDKYLPLVNDLKELYVEYFLEGGIAPKWTSGDEKNFLLAAQRLQDFWENSEVSDSGLNMISDYFMKSIYETSYGKKVPPRWLHNDITFENFTKYLIEVGEMYGEA